MEGFDSFQGFEEAIPGESGDLVVQCRVGLLRFPESLGVLPAEGGEEESPPRFGVGGGMGSWVDCFYGRDQGFQGAGPNPMSFFIFIFFIFVFISYIHCF